jgi:hypothetical protein
MKSMNNFETITAHNFETIALSIADRVMDLPGQNMGRSFRDLVQQCQDTLMGEWVDRRSWKKDAGPVNIQVLAERVQLWFKAMDSAI